jgi:hypothetical protein
MIDVRIVCTHDAVKLAEMLMRLLEAEEHQVRLLHGRQSLADLEEAKASCDAVVLIWSANAPSQHYMREWARNIPPARLIELARAPGWPESERKAPVLDFIAWRGERGARAWNALNERLRIIARATAPKKPPPSRAALALGLASIAAVGGAAMVRMNETLPTPATSPETREQSIAVVDPETGVGGPLSAIEPASVEELEALRLVPNPRFTPLELTTPPDLVEIPETALAELPPPTLFERLSALNPLRIVERAVEGDS